MKYVCLVFPVSIYSVHFVTYMLFLLFFFLILYSNSEEEDKPNCFLVCVFKLRFRVHVLNLWYWVEVLIGEAENQVNWMEDYRLKLEFPVSDRLAPDLLALTAILKHCLSCTLKILILS